MNRKTWWVIVAVALQALSGCLAAQDTSEELNWPPVTRQSRSWTRWWRLGSIVNQDDLTVEMEKYRAAGLGELEIRPIYGVKGCEDRFISYLSPAWIEMLVHTLNEGDQLDLCRVCESAGVTLNGKELGTLIVSPFQVAIPSRGMQESNTLQIKVSSRMANRIADLDPREGRWKKFYNVNFAARRGENQGPDSLFNASKWPPRDSGPIGPATLSPVRQMSPQ